MHNRRCDPHERSCSSTNFLHSVELVNKVHGSVPLGHGPRRTPAPIADGAWEDPAPTIGTIRDCRALPFVAGVPFRHEADEARTRTLFLAGSIGHHPGDEFLHCLAAFGRRSGQANL